MRRERRWLSVPFLVLGLAACGGGDPLSLRTPGGQQRPAHAATPARRPVTKEEKAVIRGWSDELRHGHVAAASRYFALPSLVSNNTAPIRLETRADVRFFNRTLPCGAKLVKTERSVHDFVIATFRLTDRPGPGGNCAGGAGDLARTAFLIRHRRIAQWLRVPDPAPGTESGTQDKS